MNSTLPDTLPNRLADRAAERPPLWRGLALLLAAATALALYLDPASHVDDAGVVERIGLASMLVGSMSAVLYGLGYRSPGPFLQRAMAPRLAWPAMLLGTALNFGWRYLAVRS